MHKLVAARWRWAPAQAIHIIHDRQIARHGGASGLRDEGLLQGALQRPINKWQYENTDTFGCAAAYAQDDADNVCDPVVDVGAAVEAGLNEFNGTTVYARADEDW